jgi:nucleoid DNA-binding protein
MTTSSRTITKKDVVEHIAERTGLRKSDVKTVVQEFLDEIVGALGSDHRLEFRDFGVFEVRERKARTAQNPKTLEPVPVPAKRIVKFKPGRKMKDALDTPPGTPTAGEIEAKPASLVGTPNGQL